MEYKASIMNVTTVDVVIPTLTKPNAKLLKVLENASWVNNIFVTKEKPLSVARKNVLLKANTEFVAMFDDDVEIPECWFSHVSGHVGDGIGAVASVAKESDYIYSSYARLVSFFVPLNKISNSPHITNVLVRRSLLADYEPPRLFFGEDQFFKNHVTSKGYLWKILEHIGVLHVTSNRNMLDLGVVYGKYGLLSNTILFRRFLARLVFGPYLGMTTLDHRIVSQLMKHNVQFFAGWLKALCN